MGSVVETVEEVLTGKADLKEVKKKLERALIKNIYAPLMKNSRHGIVSKYDTQITEAASEGKTAVETIIGQLDTSIRGKGRKAIESTIKKHKADYDHL
ncbi:hypothetical protein [Streptococcus macacae]|uniref:Uncharacterized protein n=1 Tax=Streptococcus macacae NCTC 11558 TaxID=764298 RepID=G5JV94_9STRE|nr:hypothetical protein [Streptococcus macacae]EHJ53023.1 hypothetical protein STRMA_1806 [Streptococcus macacae NCTC 11558]SUN77720.1 Uncharacterised protein [Streptococcus macacae NCTC 11558]